MVLREFETDVQQIKYRVLRSVAEHALNQTLSDAYYDVPHEVIVGDKPTMRCCVYKERAIVGERVHNALGGDGDKVIEVIDIACDECPVDRYSVSNSCRGCLARRCMKVCPKQAITKGDDGRAKINPDLCIHCGRCAQVCPYQAITENVRPCERACKVGAIKMNDRQKAQINYEKCISCGACVTQCPFGAVVDNSQIAKVVQMIQQSDHRGDYIIAIVAPAIASQFKNTSIGQVNQALMQLGFHDVVEVALGADMVAKKESVELAEKGFLTSSCCPAFVQYIKAHVPQMADKISHNLSPMAEIGRYIKENSSWPVRTVFIGPCTAKKMEQKLPTVKPWVDAILTFEELQALLDAAGFPPEEQEDVPVNDASYFGRVFARSGGLTEAVAQALKEQNIDFEPKVEVCSGIDACKTALLKAKMGKLDANFIEGMACDGGCVHGAGVVSRTARDRMLVDKYAKDTEKSGIKESVFSYQTQF